MSQPTSVTAHVKLIDIVNDYAISDVCGHVLHSFDVVRCGTFYPLCAKPSRGSRLYFMFGISAMADLIQHYYEMKPSNSSTLIGVPIDTPIHQLAVAIFYSSLGELLLENFLIYSMKKQGIDPDQRDQKLSDVSMEGRLDLFRELTNLPFKTAIAQLSHAAQMNYAAIVKSYIDIREKRNRLLHAGNPFIIAKDMPKQCFLDAPNLVQLFVDLHNEYIAVERAENA